MQGKKELHPKMMYQVNLNDLVPEDNFYRLIVRELDLKFLYKATEKYYGVEGQESIDPVVFFKICLVGYLNNITSDRKLIEYCSDSLAIRLFLKYDIDEPLPWHSTISRTRQLYGEEVFLSLFRKVLSMCVSKGMVSGRRQAIDSAYIKANASMDSLLEKEVLEDAACYTQELSENIEHTVSESKKKQVERHHDWKTRNWDNPGISNKEGKTGDAGDYIKPKFLSNHTHYSPTDPDARISTKPGKPRNLNYSGQISVDTSNHVITGAFADYADKRDSQSLEELCEFTNENLKEHHMKITRLVADTAYSSGEALKYLEENNIDAFIPNFGRYKPEREGFLYNESLDQYECQRGNKAILPLQSANVKNGKYLNKRYSSNENDCKTCTFREQCCGKKTKYKKLDDSIHKEYYDRMHKKLTKDKVYTQRIFRIRASTVEPVLGTLLNFLNMRRVNTRGLELANKHVLMAAIAYNLKKCLKYTRKEVGENAAISPIPVMGGWDNGISFIYFTFSAFYLIINNYIAIIYIRRVHLLYA
jgi:transposase